MMLPNGYGHLTYCSNIHPGESWTEVRENLGRHLPLVREHLAPDVRFGIGLRLSAEAAQALAQPEALSEFQEFLAHGNFYVFTINGFPYGTFHGRRVKEEVYLPDWLDERRLHYTDLLADLLVQLLPREIDLSGSISTVPGAFKPNAQTPAAVERMADLLLRHTAHLVQLRARTGKLITLALEPEPCCFLETIDETVAFFREYLFADRAARRLAELTGLSQTAAHDAVREHLGVCLDLCHAAVEFEDPVTCVTQLKEAGIGIRKMQITAGLRLPELSATALAELRQFDNPVYLHQVIESGPEGIKRYVDLPEALRSLTGRDRDEREWRVHCHVPVFLDTLGTFSSTRPFIREILRLHRDEPLSDHLEVETYTWSVLPPQLRAESLDRTIARELTWVHGELT